MEAILKWDERIGRRLKLRDINILMAVVQAGGMAKAARHLSISQPVVSKAVADLEHALGVRLLDRSHGGVTPTPYGRAILHRALAAFDELRQGVKDIESLNDPTSGEVRAGGTPPMAAALLPVAIARLQRRHRRMVAHVTEAQTGAALYHDLREREVDFVVGRILGPTIERDLDAQILFDEPLLVVAGKQNSWTGRRRIELADLVDEPWIMPPDTRPYDGATVGALIASTFADLGLEAPRPAIVSRSLLMYGPLLTTGPYLAMLPRSVMKLSSIRQSLRALPVTLKAAPGPVGIVTLKNRTLSPAVQLLIRYIREVARPLSIAG
jgi:DNA-binding transcriptional LysR family regulator